MSNYFISISDRDGSLEQETIHDPNTKLKVKVFDLLESPFKPSKNEVQYFVTAGSNKFAFQTEGYKKQRQLLILHMIARYCVYLGLIEAQIHSTLQ
ncbi:hypothetical protein MUY27_14530 [Mucilaginibacter sp. RS28]|uniref:Uncharacterized protein n=1 Tax=Mucilaginibacter straminoryzae TaxID=2932774 RepID=A0A9X2B9Z3_9SPHI|nr:hypothetical protein [Mucilaginibacter straminoryzae]MCJ8210931.1 hypothetical protein [Mucilaginibacter straminoryzae]